MYFLCLLGYAVYRRQKEELLQTFSGMTYNYAVLKEKMPVTAIYPVIQIQELSATKETIALPEPLRRSRERDVSCGCTNGAAQLAKFTSAPATSVSVPVSRSTLGNSLTGGAPPVRFSIFSKAAVLRRSVLQGRTFVAKASSRNIFTWHDLIKIRQNRVFCSLCFSSILDF